MKSSRGGRWSGEDGGAGRTVARQGQNGQEQTQWIAPRKRESSTKELPPSYQLSPRQEGVSVGALGASGQGAVIRGASYWVLTADSIFSSPYQQGRCFKVPT